MDFDLRTTDSAYYFVLNFMGMTGDEFVTELNICCENDYEVFWSRNIERIKAANISGLRIMAFHVLGSLDECCEIRNNGLMNLQIVLSNDTTLKRQLERVGITFDIPNRVVSYRGKTFDIDYEKYRYRDFPTNPEKSLKKIAYRVYYDFCANGFMAYDNILDYGTNIHKRPEFLMTLGTLFCQAKNVENDWANRSKSFRIDFYATVDQVHRSSFNLGAYGALPYDDWNDLDDEMKLKKWMLFHAMDRARNKLREAILYIRDDVILPTSQIISVSEFDFS